jgi:hypothetical protein
MRQAPLGMTAQITSDWEDDQWCGSVVETQCSKSASSDLRQGDRHGKR